MVELKLDHASQEDGCLLFSLCFSIVLFKVFSQIRVANPSMLRPGKDKSSDEAVRVRFRYPAKIELGVADRQFTKKRFI